MQNKTLGINVRVTPEEKEKLQQNAKYCGLSISEYLRRLGLGKDLKTAMQEKDYRAFRMLETLKTELSMLKESEIIGRVEAIQNTIKK